MSFVNTICDKVYVINLTKDKHKMESAKQQLETQSIQYERFNAIEGSISESTNQFTPFCNKFCANGLKGCAASHRALWQTMIDNKYDYILVLEDDLILDKDFNVKLALLYSDVPKDFDILYLGSLFYCGDNSFYSKLRNLQSKKISDNVLQVDGCAGFHGYIISNKCAQKFLQEKVSFHIDDNAIGWIQKYNRKAYALYPPIVKQTLIDSNLSSKYPPILNKALSNIYINDDVPLNWLLSENSYKFSSIHINSLLIILLIIAFFVPLQYYYLIYLWLFSEWLCSTNLHSSYLVSPNMGNSIKYATLFGIIFFIKYYIIKY